MSVATELDVGFEGTEREQSQWQAIDLLSRLGYLCLTRQEALALRGGKTSHVLLEDVLRSQLQKLNRIHHKGRTHAFSGPNIRRAIQALEEVPLAEGTQRAGEQVYDLLRLGKSLEQIVAGDKKSFTLRYIDWEHPENNVFHATTEYQLQRAGDAKPCKLDIVLFVNGIPFVVIECKAPEVGLEEAITDLLAYQSRDYVPELFKSVQLLLAINRSKAKYATTGAKTEFWSVWRSREEIDAEIEARLREPLPPAEREVIRTNFVREERQRYMVETLGRLVTEQDRALFNLCLPARLLELAGRFIVYDAGEKKIARYQQYYAVKEAMKRVLRHLEEPTRRGGVIWHTQGSGKTLTMVMLANAIAQAPEIVNPRIVLVTDRVDLDKQIRRTFLRCGLEPRRATSGANLRQVIESGQISVITTLIHKFAAALARGELNDQSSNIFVLVDEGHRTQYGSLHPRMQQVFPNACYIAFTGTPLTRPEKSTIGKFGDLIDTYTMEQAVADHAVVPLLYERRHIDQEVNQQPIDAWFERICQGLTDEQRKDLKKKYSRSEMLMKAEQRLKTIAFDVWGHYRAHWKRNGYFKAQLVAPDKKSAIRLHRFLEEINETVREETERVSSAVVISPPDEREGYDASDEQPARVVQEFWREMMERYGNEGEYTQSIIEGFGGDGAPEILIVVDKLITGFDEPRNTVLYLTRRLESHTLLQAIARVNRLYEGKEFGYIVDYAGVLGELDEAMAVYQRLAEQFDPRDLEGMLSDVREQVEALPQRHAALLDFFKTVRNKSDMEECELLLADKPVRDEFYQAFAEFAKCLRLALSTEFFYEETPTDTIERYKADLKQFVRLRASVQQRYADTVDMKRIEPQIAKLLDTYVSSEGAEVLTPEPVNIFNTAAMEEALAALGTDAGRADTIAHATARTISERMDEDPALFRKFSEMLRETIQAFRDRLISEMEYLRTVRELRDRVVSRSDSEVPARLAGSEVAPAYYRIALERLGEIAPEPLDRELAAEIAERIDTAIQEAVRVDGQIVVDWRQKLDVQNRILASIDDAFFELANDGKIQLNWQVLEEIAAEAVRIAKSRLP